MDDAVQKGFAHGFLWIVPGIRPMQAGKGRLRLIQEVNEAVDVFQLLQDGAGELFTLAKYRPVRPLEKRNLRRRFTLIGQKQRQIRVQPILAGQLQRTHLRRTEFDRTLRHLRFQGRKRQLLVQASAQLVGTGAVLTDHFTDALLGQRLRRASFPDIYTARLQTFFTEIVRATGSGRHDNFDDLFFIDTDRIHLHKRHHVRSQRILQ